MGKVLDCIGPAEESFINKQKVFFVATAPLSQDGHVNVSPKAPGTSVVVLDQSTVAYADLSGSGAETAAHVIENQRMTLLFCNLEDGPPKMLRLHGTATVVVKEKVDKSFLDRFPTEISTSHGFRAVYILKVHRISSSCGYSMPVMTFQKYRQTLADWTKNRGDSGMEEYGILKNSFSIDGLPSVAVLRHEQRNDTTNSNNSSKRIVPVHNDGYIQGELVENGSNKETAPLTNPTNPAKTPSRWSWVSFLFGMIFGATIGVFIFSQLLELKSLEKSLSEIDL